MIDSISQAYNQNPAEGQIRIDGLTHNSQGIKGLNTEATKGRGISLRMALRCIVLLLK